MQRKTDSRADKPDTFPGFDLHDDSTTLSPRKRRRQAYSKLIRLFIENTRDRLETIRDVIKDESELHFRLTQPQNDASSDIIETKTNGKIWYSNENDDEENRKFIDLAYTDATNSDESANNANDVTQTYLNSLFAAVGYSRVTSTTSAPVIVEQNDMPQDSIITRYILNPLFRIWYSALEPSETTETDELIDIESNVNSANSKTHITQVFFDNNDNDTESKMQTKHQNTNKMDEEVNESRINNFNYSLPLIQLSPNNDENTTIAMALLLDDKDNMNNVNINRSNVHNVTVDDTQNKSNKKPRNTAKSTIEEAASAFQNAFYKYSNNIQRPMENSKHGMSDAAVSNVNERLTDAKTVYSNELLDGELFVGNIFDANASTNIQVVASKKQKPHEFVENQHNDGIIIANSNETTATMKSFSANAGILILEMFGTVIGMTWHAIAQIPNYLNGNTEH